MGIQEQGVWGIWDGEGVVRGYGIRKFRTQGCTSYFQRSPAHFMQM